MQDSAITKQKSVKRGDYNAKGKKSNGLLLQELDEV